MRESSLRSASPTSVTRPRNRSMSPSQPKLTTMRSGGAPPEDRAWNSPGAWKIIRPCPSLCSRSPARTRRDPRSTYSSSQKSCDSPWKS